MKKVDIGLDIGIASVGWSVTDNNTLEIVKHGVRRFPTVDSAKDSKLLNEERREARSARRQIQRRRNRRKSFIKLLTKWQLINDIDVSKKDGSFLHDFINKYINLNNSDLKDKQMKGLEAFVLRKKALSTTLKLNEYIYILYWYVNHRGFKYEVVDSKDEKSSDHIMEKYHDENTYPVDWQLKYLDDNGFLNGTFNRSIHHDDYKREIEEILNHQKILEKAFIKDFLEIFDMQRSFQEGPGNQWTPTKYGLYSTTEREEDGSLKKIYNNIWDKTIGKCSIYPNEQRAPKNALSSEIFNLLNDLNNLIISNTGEKLSQEVKYRIIKMSFNTKTNINKAIQMIEKE